MSLLQTLMYSGDGSGDTPVKMGTRGQSPQHSTPIKDHRKSSLKFSSLGSSLSIGNYTSPISKGDNLEPSVIKGDNSFTKPTAADKDLTVTDIPIKEVKSAHSSKDFTRSKSIKQVSNVTESELGIIQKQRQELQLLISELRDRDRELTDMVHAHQSQLLSWEEDRQKLLTLQQKCTNYEADITEHKKNLTKLASYVKTLKTERQNQRLELDAMQQQLHRVNHEKGNQSMILSEFQEKDKNMNENVKALSAAIGRLEAREAELATLIKLKDKELTEASNHMTELTKRLGQMDQRFKECHHIMVESQQQAKDWKHKYSELRRDHEKLKENYTSLMSESHSRQAEAEESRKKVSELEREITLAGERDCRKSDVLESMKAKQERTAQELATLRQLYDRQQRELSLMQLNLDSSRELVLKQQAGLNSQIDLIEPELIPEKERESPRLYSGVSSPQRRASPRNIVSPRRSKPSTSAMSPRSPRHNTSDALQVECETSLEEERQKFDELYLKFLRDPEATGSPNSSFNTFNPDELNASTMSDNEENISPTSKLHKLLAESRLMVQKLEQSTASKNQALTMLDNPEQH